MNKFGPVLCLQNPCSRGMAFWQDDSESDYEDYSDYWEEEEEEEEDEDEDGEKSKEYIIARARECLEELFASQHKSNLEFAFIHEMESYLCSAYEHEAILEFIVTVPNELDKQCVCRTILDLFLDSSNFPMRITNQYANHVLVSMLQYLFQCTEEEWMRYVLDIVEKARGVHLSLRTLEHRMLKEQLSKIKPSRICVQRPGQPVCEYYMESGRCGFGDCCRFHHPKERLVLGNGYEQQTEQDDAHDRAFDNIVLCRELLRLLDGGIDACPAAPPRSGDDADSPFAELVKAKSKRKSHAAAPHPDGAPLWNGLRSLGINATGVLTDPASRERARDAVLRIQQASELHYGEHISRYIIIIITTNNNNNNNNKQQQQQQQQQQQP